MKNNYKFPLRGTPQVLPYRSRVGGTCFAAIFSVALAAFLWLSFVLPPSRLCPCWLNLLHPV